MVIGYPYVNSLGHDTSALLGWKTIMAQIHFTNKKYHSKQLALVKVGGNLKR